MSDEDIYKQAVQFYQAQNLADAEKLFRQILSRNSRHAQSLHMMGLIALDVQRYDVAEELVRAAITEQDNNRGFHFTLGRILNRQEKKEEAVISYKKAISLKPDYVDALNNLGTTLISLGREDEAIDIFERILQADPGNFNALSNTASIFYKKQKYELAIKRYREAEAVNPASAKIHYDIGRALMFLKNTDEAYASFQQAIHYDPDYVDALINIGDILRYKGEPDDALSYFSRVIAIEDNEEAYSNIISIHIQQKNYIQAINEGMKTVDKFPNSAASLNNLAAAYDAVYAFQGALDISELSLKIDPNNAVTYSNMASALKNLGRLDEAIAMCKKALELEPYTPWIYTNLLLAMVYSSVPPEELFEISRQFGEHIADPLHRKINFTNDKTPGRKLRIGYVSGDFCSHSVSYFLSPIYKSDKSKFELFAYSKVNREDSVTQTIKGHFDHWRDIFTLSDEAATDLIEADKIDILVDLAGHTGLNGLMIFARKPAPIQVSWLGYPATTGMKAIDYRITDAYAEPVGMAEHLNVETLWRLPDIFCAYQPRENSPDVIDHPPFQDNGFITFGCFNNFSKVTDAVLQAWASIMKQVPDSHFMMEIRGVEDANIKRQLEMRMTHNGMPAERLKLVPRKPQNQYVLYNQIDIALDPFPCVGGTTSMDTLWMGVPLVTLAGNSFLSRMGVTILNNTGMPELVAQDIDDYIRIATTLAQDREKLRGLRQGLRERFALSPAMDQEKFAKNMEAAYQKMWEKWVADNF